MRLRETIARLVRGPDYWEQRAKTAEDELYRKAVALDASEKHAAYVEAQRKGWADRALHAEKRLKDMEHKLWLVGQA